MTMPNDHEHAFCGEVEPIAWRSTTIAYKQFVTESRYRNFLPWAQKWYEPYRCANCRDAAVQIAALTAEVERVRAETIEKCIAAADKRVRAASGVSYTTAVCELQAIPDDLRALAGEGV